MSRIPYQLICDHLKAHTGEHFIYYIIFPDEVVFASTNTRYRVDVSKIAPFGS